MACFFLARRKVSDAHNKRRRDLSWLTVSEASVWLAGSKVGTAWRKGAVEGRYSLHHSEEEDTGSLFQGVKVQGSHSS